MNPYLKELCFWPLTVNPNLIPWWLILWRFPWFLLFQLSRVLTTVVVFFGWGPNMAKEFWNDAI